MSENESERFTLRELYPQRTDDELPDAEENLRRYLRVVMQIFEHIRRENPKVLTELRRRARLRKEKAHK